MSDLVRAHCDALAYLRGGGVSATLNCGYGRGFSVLEVIETVKRVSGSTSRSRSPAGGPGTRRRSWRLPTVPVLCSNGTAFRRPANHRVPRAGMGAQAFDVRRLTSVDTADVCSPFSKPSCLGLPALRLRFSNPQRTCSPVIRFLPHRSCAADRLDAKHVTIHFILISDQTYPC